MIVKVALSGKTEIKIADYIGGNAITVEHGETIYKLIKDSKDIVLDFEGINIIAAPFANFSVGRLLENRTLEEFNQQVKLVNFEKDWFNDLFKLVVENSNRYYRDPKFRKRVEERIKEMSQDDYDWH